MAKVTESTINIADEPENYYVVQIVQCVKGRGHHGFGEVIKQFDLPKNEAAGFLLTVRSLGK